MNISLLEHLLRGVVFLALASGIWLALHRRMASYSYWRGVFAALLAMGIVGLGPALRHVELASLQWNDSAPIAISNAMPGKIFAGVSASTPDTPRPLPSDSPKLRSTVGWGWLLFWTWLAGVCLCMSRLGLSWLKMRRLTARAVSGGRLHAECVETEAIATPLAFGLIRPIILVPSGFGDWPAADREMALAHERAHVRNHDGCWQLLANLAAILHWPNPLAWLLLRRLERDREIHADAAVLRTGAAPNVYAEFLVRLASAPAPPSPAATLPMARKSTVPMRVHRILKQGESGRAQFGPLCWLSLGLLAGAGLTLGVTSFLGKKDDTLPPVEGLVVAIDSPTRIVERALAKKPASLETTPAVMPAEAEDQATVAYRVPPNFLSAGEESSSAAGSRPAARAILERMGVLFPEGATAVYNAATSQLIVRNTEENLSLTEQALEGLIAELQQVAKQIYFTTRIVTVPRNTGEFDWLSAPDVAGGVSGVFTDPQFQVVIRKLNETTGVDLLTAPSIVARSGQRAFVEVDDQRLVDVAGTVGPDEFTIDVDFYDGSPDEAIATAVTIWDGQTVVRSEPFGDDLVKLTFITAKLIDPAGQPISPR